MNKETLSKLDKLMALIKEMGSVVIGFSGGVDSAMLTAAAWRCLGSKAVAVTACSATLPASEQEEAVQTAKAIGIQHILLNIDELESSDFAANDGQRCYYCKQTRFGALSQWAKENGYTWVLEGSNADDCKDYRPGMKAVAELEQVRSPLLEAGLTKAEIREIAHEWGLAVWDKPSAACLSSRVAYGLTITNDRLHQIEQAEEVVKKFCTGQVRVRHHDDLARIEVSPEDIPLLAAPENARYIAEKLKEIGFTYITLDLTGYRTGSMNAALAGK